MYQGFGAFIGNAVMGILFGWIYTRWGRLLPPRDHARAPRRHRVRRLPVRRAGVPRALLVTRRRFLGRPRWDCSPQECARLSR
ncbi:CPBP family intramembrane glutamic endopeptidase [Curtobacterium sp. MCPF17_052]|uniref:CPBP family intramembrane glutamic endopeptidase n=1 Tax=Curtobacterium sp. MCPF17_052 TaxID=2175655 RepID=UPI003463C4DC